MNGGIILVVIDEISPRQTWVAICTYVRYDRCHVPSWVISASIQQERKRITKTWNKNKHTNTQETNFSDRRNGSRKKASNSLKLDYIIQAYIHSCLSYLVSSHLPTASMGKKAKAKRRRKSLTPICLYFPSPRPSKSSKWASRHLLLLIPPNLAKVDSSYSSQKRSCNIPT